MAIYPSFVPNSLFAGDRPTIARNITLIVGQNLTRGALLGQITGSGKYTLALSASVDGSQNPLAVLAADTDATAADTATSAYWEGEFAAEQMTFGAGVTTASADQAFAARGQPIFLRTLGLLG